MSSLIVQMKTAQDILTRYGMSTYLVFGNIGFILSTIYFCQRHQRQVPCALYIISASVTRILAMNVGVIPILYSLDYPNPSSTSMLFCKLQYYIRHVFNQMMRTFIVLACVDRYAICSMRSCIRSFSSFRIAIRLIPCVIIVWLAFPTFIFVFQTIKNGKCGRYDDVHVLIYTIYNVVTTGFLPPFAMILFGVLVIKALRQIRARVRPTADTATSATKGILKKRDRDLIRIALIEVVIYLLTTTPYTIVLVYSSITTSMDKSNEQKQIESFVSYIAQSFLLFLNNALPFWVYLLISPAFRLEYKNLIIRLNRKLRGQATPQPAEATANNTINTN